ncbi:hypothetical protein DIE15_03565 [Burkholderia sp. Bp9031]|uniref:hypothetical protein n=1 Tax=Burkholderia sp. Bp9031 TaxID=2184566 RepID=UPI000F5EE389|nr:hypothetical protein [Burkholderia sp. Bp9031]RQZ19691.1 hypothetical protein DIE15_03565 [Burkholderia sp. Bp9031]
MSRAWTLSGVEEYQYGKPPSIWWCVLAVVIIQTAGMLITVFNWEQGKPVMSEPFFVRALLLPLLVSGVVCSAIYSGYEDWIERVDWWNFLCRSERAAWRQWAQAHMVIVDSIALTPEPELGERLLGLEGSAPMNPGKILPLPDTEGSTGVSRLAVVLEQLVSPFAARLARHASSETVDVILQSADKDDLTELRAVWKKLNLPDLVQFGWMPFDAKQANIETWFDEECTSDFRLLLACQLHADGMEPAWSEAAVAMLLTSPCVAASLKETVRPQARLFRPIAMPSDSVADALETLLASEQTPRRRIRHAWMSDLPSRGRHATLGAIKDVGLELPAHDVDRAIGKPGPVNALLLQALAAQMVTHGQGAQLVASAGAQKVRLNLVGTELVPVPRVDAGYGRVLSLSVTVGGSCCLGVVIVALSALNASQGWFWACLGGSVLLFLMQMGGSYLRRNLVEDDFFRQLRRMEAR